MLKLFSFLNPYRFYIALIFVFVIIQSLTELSLPTLMADIVQQGILKVTIPEDVMKTIMDQVEILPGGMPDLSGLTIQDLTDMGIQIGDIPFIYRTGGIMLLVALIGGIATIFTSLLAAKVSSGMGKNIRDRLFEKVMNFSLSEIDEFGTASLITRTTNDVLQVQTITVFMLRMFLGAPILAIGGVFMAMQKDRSLTFIFLIVLPIIALIITIIAKKGIPLFKVLQKKLDTLNLVLRERLTGIRVIRAYDKEPSESARFDFANKDLTDTAVKVNRIMASLMPILMLILNLTSLAIVWFSAKRIDAGTSNIGNMMAFIQYAMLILISLIMFSVVFVMLPRAIASAERINAVLLTAPTILDNVSSAEFCNDKKGYIEFKNVTFSYPKASAPVLHKISFSASPGETTAIIGSTGSGKSTIVNLIPRFYDINEGEILIDCVNIKDMAQKDLRDKIGFVPQRPVLFSGTIAENLRYGNENATDEDLNDAARIAQAFDFIGEKENGFEEILTQGGTNLSGGQRQRLSIARALVRRPEIYIFDDSFSALDYKTDRLLRKELKASLNDETVIIVAQRINTVMDADRIIVLNEGEMVGMGTHKQLLADNEVYREIVYSQLSEEEANG